MKSKPNDVPYCGVGINKITDAAPVLDLEALGLYCYMIKERYAVRLKKDVYKQPAPWSKDPIFQQFRFTNVRREHDRETLWLIHNITSNPALSYKDKILNCLLFRLFNKHQTNDIIGTWINFDNLDKVALRKKITDYATAHPEYVWFTNAFITGGLKRAAGSDILVVHKDHQLTNDEKIPVKMSAWLVKEPEEPEVPKAVYLTEKEAIKFCNLNPDYALYEAKEMDMRMRIINMVEKIYKDGFMEKLAACVNQQEVFKLLCTYNGIADFLGYQIFVDFTYIEEFPFSENEFTIAGPGCRNGLNILFQDFDDMNYEEAIFWVRDHIERFAQANGLDFVWYDVFSDLEEYDRCGNVMSIENTFCEFSKFYRAFKGTGRPRNRYKATQEALPGDDNFVPATHNLMNFMGSLAPSSIAELICSVQPMSENLMSDALKSSVGEKELKEQGYTPIDSQTKLLWVKS